MGRTGSYCSPARHCDQKVICYSKQSASCDRVDHAYLEFEKSHIEESTVAFQQKVSVMESVDDKIDYYDLSDVSQLQPSSDFYLSQTAVICISRGEFETHDLSFVIDN